MFLTHGTPPFCPAGQKHYSTNRRTAARASVSFQRKSPGAGNTGAPQGRRLSIQDFKRAQETEDVQVSAKKVEGLFEPKLVDLLFAKNPASEQVGLDGQEVTKDITRHISEKLEDEAFFFHLRHVLTSFHGEGRAGRETGKFYHERLEAVK